MKEGGTTGRWRPDGFTALLAGIAALGVALILARVAHGVGLRTDGMYYIELARALAEGERGLAWLSGNMPHLAWGDHSLWQGYTPLIQSAFWPPLHSILMTLGGGFVIDPIAVAGPLNAVAFGLTILVAGHWLRQRVRSRFLVALGCVAILCSIPLAWWASWVMSEAIFVLLTTLALYFSDRFLATGQRSSLVWAALFTALACLTRYAGIFLIVAFLPLLALQHGIALPEKARRVGTYLAVSAAPVGMWLIRNVLVTGTLTGPRGGEPYGSFVDNAASSLRAIESWNPLFVDLRVAVIQVDTRAGWLIGAAIVGAFMVVLAVVVAWGALRWWRGGQRSEDSFLPVVGGFTFGYILFIVIMRSITPMLEMSRFLVPAYVPFVLLIVFLADRCLTNHQRLALPRRSGDSKGSKRQLLGVEVTLILAAIPVALLSVSVVYAGYITIRDTRTAVVNPEYSWNYLVYNAEHSQIDTPGNVENLQSLVAGETPLAHSQYDVYLVDGDLIYFKKQCGEEELGTAHLEAGQEGAYFFVHVLPSNNSDLPGHRKEFGSDSFFYPVSANSAISNGQCLATAPLPGYAIESVTTGQSRGGVTLWQETFRPVR